MSANELPHRSHRRYQSRQGQTQKQLRPNLLDHIHKSISEHMLYSVSNLPGASHIFLWTTFEGLLAMGTAKVIRLSAIFCFSHFPYLDIHPTNRVESLPRWGNKSFGFVTDHISHQSHDQAHGYHSKEDEYCEL